MKTVGVRELSNNTAAVIRIVADEGTEVLVTRRGEPVGLFTPLDEEAKARIMRSDRRKDIEALRALAVVIGESWNSDLSAVEAVDEQRR